MLTTDLALLRKRQSDKHIPVVDPVDFIRKIERDQMKTDDEVCLDGKKVLVNTLGSVEAERFITLVNREQLDDTEWRKRQWLDETVSTLAEKARLLRAANPDR